VWGVIAELGHFALVLAVQGWIAAAFLLFILTTSNPFLRLATPPLEGNDLNPVLQDIGLAIHPPLLYLGYVGCSISFAFAVAALIDGRIDAAWARWARPWTLAAWTFLTVGIAMGSYWAYYELGWGGFWFWDPVENASLMPWLAATALLHSAVVMEKRDALKIWTVLLAILAFSLSLIGTFLVRSGVLTSVHAFASDPTRGIFILCILVVFIGGALALFAFRAGTLARGACPQQHLPLRRRRDGHRRHPLSAGARGIDRRTHLGRRAVLQSDVRAAGRAAAGDRAVRADAGVETRRSARRRATFDAGVRADTRHYDHRRRVRRRRPDAAAARRVARAVVDRRRDRGTGVPDEARAGAGRRESAPG
jgi:hypothetical protein